MPTLQRFASPRGFVVGLALLALAAAGCKNEEQLAVEKTASSAGDLVNKGRAAIASRKYDAGVEALTQATALAPNDPATWILLAEAQKQSGNEAAAVLSLKTAEGLGARGDPALKRERAELYRRLGQTKEAMGVFVELRDANLLTDAETLELAHMQAATGDVKAAWASLEQVQKRKPDDPDAKAVEAEVLLLKGEEVLGARLLDRLISDTPGLAPARVARAKYFLANGLAEAAEQDLAEVSPDYALRPEVRALKARTLNTLKKYDAAIAILEPLSDANPKDAEVAAQLAETFLLVGRTEEAEALVDRALMVRPRFARAIYVRGRAKEVGGNLSGAATDYEEALKSDPAFAPAMSRAWRLYEHQGQKGLAVSALEGLLSLNEASPEEKVALITLYVETGDKPTKARALLDEALKKKPKDPALLELKKKLGRAGGGGKPGGGIIIMRRGK